MPPPPPHPPQACACCHTVFTARRCTACGVCVLCSDECAIKYKIICGGPAACAYHGATRRSASPPPLDEECLGSLAAPTAVMLPGIGNLSADEAVPALLRSIVAYISAHQQSAPLTLNSYVCATLVPTVDTAWTRGVLRTSHLPTHPSGALDVAQADRDKMAARMLASASRLAVAQSTAPFTRPPKCSRNGHAFLLAKVVRVASAKARGRGFKSGLQFDLVIAKTIDNMQVELLTCERSEGGFRPALAVYKLKGELHSESGFPVFKLTGDYDEDYELLSREERDEQPPILARDKVGAALSMVG